MNNQTPLIFLEIAKMQLFSPFVESGATQREQITESTKMLRSPLHYIGLRSGIFGKHLIVCTAF